MALSDCPKCWETPCRCGHDYESWTIEALTEQIGVLQRVRNKKMEEKRIASIEPDDCETCQGEGKIGGLYGYDCSSCGGSGKKIEVKCTKNVYSP